LTLQEDSNIGAQIRARARHYGFTRVRFADASPPAGIADLDQFLAEGRHAEMAYLERGRDARADPSTLLPGVQSVVVLGTDYAHPRPPDPGGLTGKVASYAWGRDYHNLVGKRLRKLVRDLRAEIPGFDGYWGVDARPLMERAWAARAGLGFSGKNCMMIVPGQTSYLFLAAILVNVRLTPDAPMGDHCGSCRRCIDVCPTGAFTAAGQLDARLCISYLTIEHRGAIPEALRPQLGRWVFGCEDCQEVCPHNPADPSSPEADFAPRPGHAWLDLEWVLQTSDEALVAHFMGSPIRRACPSSLKRNAAVVLGNLGDPAARTALKHALLHSDPQVQSHARWALDRL
jgi:epoxyqueuosine reductase